MSGPPGSQVARKKGKRGHAQNKSPPSQANTPNSNDKGEVRRNLTSSPVQHAFSDPRTTLCFQVPRQPNVYTDCVPLRELFVRVQECHRDWSDGRAGDAGQQHRKHQRCSFASPGFQRVFSELPYPRGIVNSSNFCFINSILQVLIFLPAFAQLAVSVSCDEQARARCPTLATFGKWVLLYWKPGFTRLSMVAPPLMPRAAAKNASQRVLDGSVQEDAHEFLQKLLECVQQELIGLEGGYRDGGPTAALSVGSISALATGSGSASSSGGGTDPRAHEKAAESDNMRDHQKGWTVVKGKEKLAVREHIDAQGQSRLMDSIFGGTLESHLQGKQRQRDRVSVLVEKFFCLPIDVGFAPECTIEEALVHTFLTERIYDRERDKNLKKTLRVGRLPAILFLQLRRWAVTREGELVKLDNVVHLQRSLQLPRMICGDETLSSKDRTYRLVSVVSHRGSAIGRGHYVTYLMHHAATPSVMKMEAKSSTSTGLSSVTRTPPQAATVILCNDANVTVVPFTSLTKEAVYFVVYEKVH